jgi:hypothetical protein
MSVIILCSIREKILITALNNKPILICLSVLLFSSDWGCSSSSSSESAGNTQYINLGNNFGADTFMCSLPVPSLDSVVLALPGIDTWRGFFLKGITQPGNYQFGSHDGVTITYEFGGPDAVPLYSQPGGSFELTSFVNDTAHPSFEGSFNMTIFDTIPTSYYPTVAAHIDTFIETGTFSVHNTCQ